MFSYFLCKIDYGYFKTCGYKGMRC